MVLCPSPRFFWDVRQNQLNQKKHALPGVSAFLCLEENRYVLPVPAFLMNRPDSASSAMASPMVR